MKLYLVILVVISLGIYTPSIAQSTVDECTCCTKNYELFDFWLGDWDVFDNNGKLVGTNSISKQYDNCVIQEKWISAGTSRGTSYNFFDKADGSWNQIWVDNSGYVLNLKGNFVDDAMVLKSKLIKGPKQSYYNQISWFKNDDGSVTQLWEIYGENKNKISESFRGIYKKKLN